MGRAKTSGRRANDILNEVRMKRGDVLHRLLPGRARSGGPLTKQQAKSLSKRGSR